MSDTLIVKPGPDDRTVRTEDGQVLVPPESWSLLPPGDATLTRRVKSAGPSWTVQEKIGRKIFSKGVWAPREIIDRVRTELEAERSTPEFAKKRAAETRRRERKQDEYVGEFEKAVLDYLAFAPQFSDLAASLAKAVTTHATPVGSGTVARTQRIPVVERAEAAVIAWMRHQTTAYDHMTIPRVKGQRRAVRRMLAERSKEILNGYRTGMTALSACPLRTALG